MAQVSSIYLMAVKGESKTAARKEAPATAEIQNNEVASLLSRSGALEGQHDLAAPEYYLENQSEQLVVTSETMVERRRPWCLFQQVSTSLKIRLQWAGTVRTGPKT